MKRSLSPFAGIYCKRKISAARKLLQTTLLLLAVICCFQDATAANYPVTNLNDVGAGSLRQAILDANTNPGADVIDATGVTGIISLSTGQLTITDATTITGPGANLLNVHNIQEGYRVFYIGNVTATLSGLTISGGNLNYFIDYVQPLGAGISNNGNLTLTGCTVSGNLTVSCSISCSGNQLGGRGAGIFNASAATLTINNCLITNNTTDSFEPAGNSGAGIFNEGSATINNSIVSNNQGEIGGGIANGGTMVIINSAITNNQANGGGGIYTYSTLVLKNSTVSGNTANEGGGIKYEGGQAAITNCTITGNSGYGGGIDNYT
jgi:hypothetical protein